MGARWSVAIGCFVVGAAVVLSGCSGQRGYDSVLWRQVDVQRQAWFDEVERAISMQTSLDGFVRSLEQPGSAGPRAMWSTETGVTGSSIGESGAVVVFDVAVSAPKTIIAVSTLVFSGPRAPEDDPLADPSESYRGANAIYTCQMTHLVVSGGRIMDRRYAPDATGCPDELVEELPAGSLFVPIEEFYG